MTQVLTANDLRTGEPVFGDGDRWVARIEDGDMFGDPEAAAAALAAAREARTVVLDPYLIEVTADRGVPVPVSFRERIRALGPPAHPDMGKQAAGGEAVEALRRARGAGRSSGRVALIARKR